MVDEEDPAGHILEAAPAHPEDRLLIMEGGAGRLLERFAPLCAETVFHNTDYPKHARALEARARLAGVPARCVLGDIPRAAGNGPSWPDALEFPPGRFDRILYRLGKGTAALHGAVLEAWRLLREGGSLILAGHTREGVKSVAKRAEDHFGNAELLELKSSCRLIRFRKTGALPHKPLPDPGYFEPVSLVLDLPGGASVPYLTKPGLFSYRATDAGTALLARHLGRMEGMRVLDLGCGSGALSLAAIRLGAAETLAVDSNAVAIAVTRRNFAEAGLGEAAAGSAARARAVFADLASGVEGEFDLVLSNPPFHRGSDTDYTFPSRVLDAVLPRLRPEGRMLLVANQFLDYPAQAKGRFASCEILAQESGFRVYRLTR